MKTFDLPLRTSIVPSYAAGSATPTFTRASAATVVDHEGVLRYCKSGEARFWGARRVGNCLTDSETFAATGSCTLTTGQAGPTGAMNATKVVFAATGSGNRADCAFGTSPTTVAANDWAISCWMRGDVGGEQVVLANEHGDTASLTLTSGWQRFARLMVGTGRTSHGVRVYASAGTPTIYVADAQSELITGASVQAPGEYVSIGVLSAPYHGAGADGVKYFDTANGNSVASNVVSEGTGAPIADSVLLGYLAEGQYTNRLLYSEDFSNAAWVKTNVTVTADSTAAPDGATTADTLTATAANATVIQDLGVVASAQKNGALWLKRKTGSGNIQLTLDGGAGWTTVAVGADWTRFPIAQTLADEDFGVRIVTSGDEVYAWGGDVVTAGYNGSQPMGTHIPTTSAAVTRNADALTFDNDGKVPQNTFTVACQKSRVWQAERPAPVDAPISVGNYAGNAYAGIGGYGGTFGVIGSWPTVWSVTNGGPLITSGPPPKQAYTFPADMVAIKGYIDGVMFANTASEAKVSNWSSNKIGIQSNPDGSGAGGISWVRDIRVWNQVMPIDANGDVVEASGSPSGGAVLRALRQKYMRERDERERADREFYARLEAGDEQ